MEIKNKAFIGIGKDVCCLPIKVNNMNIHNNHLLNNIQKEKPLLLFQLNTVTLQLRQANKGKVNNSVQWASASFNVVPAKINVTKVPLFNINCFKEILYFKNSFALLPFTIVCTKLEKSFRITSEVNQEHKEAFLYQSYD